MDAAALADGVNSVRAKSSAPRLLTVFGISLLLLVGCLSGFCVGIDKPDFLYFDEIHYVPAARQLLETGLSPPTINLEHPPLAKEIIALSIWQFGDNAFGWRLPSALSGALAVIAIYLCGIALFNHQGAALWSAGTAILNQLLLVQSRIAMLDVFSLAFVLLAIACFIFSFRSTRGTKILLFTTGALVGLATASKWSGIFAWAFCVSVVIIILTLQRWQTKFDDARSSDWYSVDLWADVRRIDWILALGVIPACFYLAAYLPIYGASATAIWGAQQKIFTDNINLTTPHPYMSLWPNWPFLKRPVWFLFYKISEDRFMAVVSLGNPVILWAGFVAVLLCLRDWVLKRRRDAFLIVACYAALYLCWMVLPRAVGFSFYYLPAAMITSLALAYCFYLGPLRRVTWARWAFLAAALVGLIIFLPISVASVGTSLTAYERLMLLSSWR